MTMTDDEYNVEGVLRAGIGGGGGGGGEEKVGGRFDLGRFSVSASMMRRSNNGRNLGEGLRGDEDKCNFEVYFWLLLKIVVVVMVFIPRVVGKSMDVKMKVRRRRRGEEGGGGGGGGVGRGGERGDISGRTGYESRKGSNSKHLESLN
ncbi:hypothetical protein M0802_007593 [Mischocyttarus mexicanus]|nr:hypothetical protein M0802_007593 [Mischocyttarus mexicanus]